MTTKQVRNRSLGPEAAAAPRSRPASDPTSDGAGDGLHPAHGTGEAGPRRGAAEPGELGGGPHRVCSLQRQ